MADLQPSIACLGDLMLTVKGGQLPLPHGTKPLDLVGARLGGAALNLAFHLASLGRRSRLVGVCGTYEVEQLREICAPNATSLDFVIQLPVKTDTLVIFYDRNEYTRSFYLYETLPPSVIERLILHASQCDWVLFGGSRHDELLKFLSNSLRIFDPEKFVFAPSYSVYHIGPQLLKSFMEAAAFIALNQAEEQFVRTVRGLGDCLDCSSKTFICTRGEDGAIIRAGTEKKEIPSYSGVKGDKLGAGEAFLAGYLHRFLAGASPFEAGQCGALAAAMIAQNGDEKPLLNPQILERQLQQLHSGTTE